MPDLYIANDPARDTPFVAWERRNGRIVVHLNVEDVSYWAQIAYQLAHELNHIHANFNEQRDHPHKWLEESLCELASWCTLQHLAGRWREAHDPSRSSYAPALREYVENTQRRLLSAAPDDIQSWLDLQLPTLQVDRYRRNDNAVVAYALLPHATPSLWAAVGYLNRWPVPTGTLFGDYLDDWKAHCPKQLRPCVDDLKRLLIS